MTTSFLARMLNNERVIFLSNFLDLPASCEELGNSLVFFERFCLKRIAIDISHRNII